MFQALTQGQYSLARAQQSFKSLVQIHEKNGKNIEYEIDREHLLIWIFRSKVGSHRPRRMAKTGIV